MKNESRCGSIHLSPPEQNLALGRALGVSGSFSHARDPIELWGQMAKCGCSLGWTGQEPVTVSLFVPLEQGRGRERCPNAKVTGPGERRGEH